MTLRHLRRDRSIGSRHKDVGLRVQARSANKTDRLRGRLEIASQLEVNDPPVSELSVFEADLLMVQEWADELAEWEAMIRDYDF